MQGKLGIKLSINFVSRFFLGVNLVPTWYQVFASASTWYHLGINFVSSLCLGIISALTFVSSFYLIINLVPAGYQVDALVSSCYQLCMNFVSSLCLCIKSIPRRNKGINLIPLHKCNTKLMQS